MVEDESIHIQLTSTKKIIAKVLKFLDVSDNYPVQSFVIVDDSLFINEYIISEIIYKIILLLYKQTRPSNVINIFTVESLDTNYITFIIQSTDTIMLSDLCTEDMTKLQELVNKIGHSLHYGINEPSLSELYLDINRVNN